MRNYDFDTTFTADLCNGDLERFENVLEAYQAQNEGAECAGYNNISWYVYIYLNNGISICEAFNWIEYLATDSHTGDEFFFDTYAEAEEKNESINS